MDFELFCLFFGKNRQISSKSTKNLKKAKNSEKSPKVAKKP